MERLWDDIGHQSATILKLRDSATDTCTWRTLAPGASVICQANQECSCFTNESTETNHPSPRRSEGREESEHSREGNPNPWGKRMQAGLTEDRHCAISDYIGGWVDEIIQRIFVLAFNLIGDAFRDALDPKMSARV